jgi:hypothetical protein
MIPINGSTPSETRLPVFASTEQSAYLVQKANKQWYFVGMSVCPNGTQVRE